MGDFTTRFNFDPLDYALSGGEDYTLLVTISPDHADNIENAFKKEFKRPLFAIGEITVNNQIELVYPSGETKSLALTGWDHFKAKENE